jgi:hypothetical protein
MGAGMWLDRRMKRMLTIGASIMVAVYVGAPTRHAEAAEPTPRHLSCGDYSILSQPQERTMFQSHCGTHEETDLGELLKAIKRLNPATEAAEAARRGDYRLAAVIGGGPHPIGTRRFWIVEGAKCEHLEDSDVVVWLRMSDAFYSGLHAEFEGRMRKFARAYNMSLRGMQGFPINRRCK